MAKIVSDVGEIMRASVIDMLQQSPEKRLTRAVLHNKVAKDTGAATRSIGQVIRFMRNEGVIVIEPHQSYSEQDVISLPSSKELIDNFKTKYPPVMVDLKPSNGNGVVSSTPDSARREIGDYYKQRPTHTVTLEQAPVELENVHSIQLKVAGHWMPLPVFGNLRICTGKHIPKWTPQQEVIREVSAIRITYADGKTEDVSVDASQPVTVAPLG